MSSIGAQFTDWIGPDAEARLTADAFEMNPGDSLQRRTQTGARLAAPSDIQIDVQGLGQIDVQTYADVSAQIDAKVNAQISALVDQYSGALYRVAYSVTRNAAEAEDAVQETFLRVLRHRSQLEEIRDVRVWLVRITWNLVLDRKRRAKTRPENEDIDNVARLLASSELSADRRIIAAQQHARILHLIDKLPAREREVLLLSAFEEFSTGQIAAVVGATESAVRSRLFRARKQLSALMDQDPASVKGGQQ